MSQPTTYDQYILELINRARNAPDAEASRDGIGLNDGLQPGTLSGASEPPLAFNPDLIAAAQDHSAWMLTNGTFSHTGANGSSPGDRMAAAGYNFGGSYGWGENIGIQHGGSTALNQDTAAALEVDLFKSPAHRADLLGADYREVGIGAAAGTYNGQSAVDVTQDFAYSSSGSFLTGVAYDDRNGDAFYEPGEGLGGLTVQATSSAGQTYTTTTWDSGGYQRQLAAGTYKVTFSGGSLPAPVVESAMVSSQNAELDLVRDDSMSPSPTPTSTPLSPTTPVLTDGGTFGSGPDTLVVTLSEDAYRGDAQASISLDGALLTATPLTVTASHGAGAGEIFTFKGTFGAGAHDLSIAFLNDAYDGTPSTDRNLYVTGVNYDGLLPNGAVAATLYSAGKTDYTIPPANDPEASHATPPTPTPGPAPAMMANGVLSNPDLNAAGFAGVQAFSGELAAGAAPALYSPSTTHF